MQEIKKNNKSKQQLRVLSCSCVIYNVIMSLLETLLTVISYTLLKVYFAETLIRPISTQIYNTYTQMSGQR